MQMTTCIGFTGWSVNYNIARTSDSSIVRLFEIKVQACLSQEPEGAEVSIFVEYARRIYFQPK